MRNIVSMIKEKRTDWKIEKDGPFESIYSLF